MRTKLLFPLVAIFVILASCTALGIADCKGFDQCLAYSYGVHAGVQNSAASSLDFGEISSAEARNVLAIADRARTTLDTAKTLSDAGDVPAAERQLALAREVLTQLQAYLRRGQ